MRYGKRTLCDILRKYNKIDIHIITEAFKRYVRKKTRTLLLCEYGKKLKVEGKLQIF